MCMGIIKYIFKPNKTVSYGYKIAERYGNRVGNFRYGPIYERTRERWEIGEWQKASDKSAPRRSKNSVKNWASMVGRRMLKSWSKGLRLISSGGPGWYYEPGYHYFDTLKECVDAWISFGGYNRRIIYCEFKEELAHGVQWEHPVRVARYMMVMDELTINEAEREVKLDGK